MRYSSLQLYSPLRSRGESARWNLGSEKKKKTKATTNHAVSAWIYFGLTVAVKCIDAPLFLRSCEYSTRHFVLQLYATCRDYVLFFVEFFSPVFHFFFILCIVDRTPAKRRLSSLAPNVKICITGQSVRGSWAARCYTSAFGVAVLWMF